MSDRMPVEIRIGGQLRPRYLAYNLYQAIDEEHLALTTGNSLPPAGNTVQASVTCLLAAVTPETDWLLILRDDAAAYGSLDGFEAILQQLSLPYDRLTEGRYDYNSEYVRWRPGMDSPCSMYATQDGKPLVPTRDLQPILDLLRRPVDPTAITPVASQWPNKVLLAARDLARLMSADIPSLPPFSIADA